MDFDETQALDALDTELLKCNVRRGLHKKHGELPVVKLRGPMMSVFTGLLDPKLCFIVHQVCWLSLLSHAMLPTGYFNFRCAPRSHALCLL